eukprot:595405-Prorocentrum_minimum.AAC.7
MANLGGGFMWTFRRLKFGKLFLYLLVSVGLVQIFVHPSHVVRGLKRLLGFRPPYVLEIEGAKLNYPPAIADIGECVGLDMKRCTAEKF